MRRLPLLAGAAAAIIALVLPAAAQASGPGRIEVLRLECAAPVTPTEAVVRCEWSPPTSTEAAGLRLWRLDVAVDEHRQVVFRTDDTTVTGYTDAEVRRGHRYRYAIQAVTADGRVVAQSRPEHVGVPALTGVEVLRLECVLTPTHEAIGCEWSTPEHPDAHVVELWRSVDGRARQLVETFRPAGPTAYRDPVPAGVTRVVYAVLVKDERGHIVGRSRAEHVRIPDVSDGVPERPERVAP